MTEANDLKIIVGVELDDSAKSIENINKQIQQLSNKLKSIRLNIDVPEIKFDDKATDAYLKNINKQMQYLYKQQKELMKDFKREFQAAEKEFDLLGMMKQVGVRKPRKGEQIYGDFMNEVGHNSFANNYLKPQRSKTGVPFDVAAMDITQLTGQLVTPDDLLQALKNGRNKFNEEAIKSHPDYKDIDNEIQRLKAAKDEYEKTGKVLDEFKVSTNKVDDSLDKMNKTFEEQAKIIRQLTNELDKFDKQRAKVISNRGEKLGGNVDQVKDTLASSLTKALAENPDMNTNTYQNLADRIDNLKNGSSTQLAREIENEIGKYTRLEQKLDDVIDKTKTLNDEQKKFEKKGNVKPDSIIDKATKDEAKYENLQKRAEEIKKVAGSLANIREFEDEKTGLQRTALTYTDKLGQVITETYQLNNEVQKGADGIEKVVGVWSRTSTSLGQNIAKVEQTQERLQSKFNKIRNKGVNITQEEESQFNNLISKNDAESLRQAGQLVEQLQSRVSTLVSGIQKFKSDSFKNLGSLGLDGFREELKRNLSSFENVKTEDIMSVQLNEITGRWTAAVRENGNQQRVLSGQIDQTNGSLHLQSEQLRDVTNRNLGFIESLGVAIERTISWASAMTLIYGTLDQLRNVMDEIIQIDTQMTELKRVMDGTPETFNSILQDTLNLSQSIGTNFKDLLNSVNEIARSGNYTKDQLLAVAEASAIAANVSDLNSEDAMNSLIGTMNAFKIEAKDAITVVDKMNEVDNNFSVSTKQLAESLEKSASAASTYGVSLDDLLGYTTAIASQTLESGSVVGNSLKTIFSRTTSDDSVKALQKIGIEIRGLNNDVRPVNEILGELAGKWDGLSNSTKQNLAVTIAGRWQLTRFLALMDNFKMGLDATTSSLNSYGSAVNENAKYQDSLEAKINKLKNTFSEMSVTLGNSFLVDIFTLGTQALVGFMRVINGLTDTIGIFPVVLGLTIFAFKKFGTETQIAFMRGVTGANLFRTSLASAKDMYAYLNTRTAQATFQLTAFRRAANMANAGLIGLETAILGVGAGIKALGAAILSVGRTILVALPELAVFMAVGYGIDYLIGMYTKYQEEQRKTREETNRIVKNFKTNQGAIEDLANQYEILSNKVNKGEIKEGTKEYQEFLKVQQNLFNLLPSLAQYVDASGQAHLRSADAVQKEINKVKELATAKSKLFVTEEFGKKLSESNKKIKDNQSFIDGRSPEILKAKISQTGLSKTYSPDSVVSDKEIDIERVQRQLEQSSEIGKRFELFRQYADQFSASIGAMDNFTKADKEFTDNILKNNVKLLDTPKGQKEVINTLEEYITKSSVLRDKLGDAFSSSQINSFDTKQIDVIRELNEQVQSGSVKWDKWIESAKKAGLQTNEIKLITDKLRDGVNSVKVEPLISSIENGRLMIKKMNEEGEYETVDALESINKAYESSAEKMSILNDIMDRTRKGKKLTADEAMNFMSKVEGLNNAITIENGVVKVNEVALQSLRGEYRNLTQESVNAAKTQFEAQLKSTIAKLNLFEQEKQGLQKLAGAYALSSGSVKLFESRLKNAKTIEEAQYFEEQLAQAKLWQDIAKQMDNVGKISIKALDKVGISSPEKSKDKGSKTKKEKAEEPAIPKKYQSEYDSLAALIEKEREKQKTLDETSKAYRDSVAKENKLLEKQRGLLSKIDKENKQRGKKNTRDDEIQKKLSDNSKGISETQDKLIESKTKVYDNAMTKGKNLVDRYTESLSRLREGSKEYNEVIEKIGKQELANIQYAKNKIAFLESQVKTNKKLNDKQRSELKKQIDEIKSGALADAYKNYYDNLAKGEQSQIKAIRDGNDDLSDRMSLYESIKSLNEDNSLIVAENDKKIIETIDLSVKGKREEINKINSILRNTATLNKKYTQDQIEEMRDAVIKAETDIRNLLKQRKDLYKDIAETVIDSIKSQYEREKELQLKDLDNRRDKADEIREIREKELDEQKDAMDEIKEKREKEHDDEMERIRKEYEAKIKSIEDLAEKESYEKKLKKATEERNKIQAKIDALSLDESYQAKSRREDLLKELADKDEEIAEMKNDREIDLRKESLQDAQKKAEEEAKAKKELVDYEIEIEGKKQKLKYDEAAKYIEAEKKLIKDKYDSSIKLIDAEKKAVEEKYDKLLNNESEFNKIRVSIYQGTTNEISSTIQGFLTKTQENFKSLGESIDSQLINKLKDAQNLLSVVSNNPLNTDWKVGNVTNGNSGNTTSPNNSTNTPPPSTPNTGSNSSSLGKPRLVVREDGALLRKKEREGVYSAIRQLNKGEQFEIEDFRFENGSIAEYLLKGGLSVPHSSKVKWQFFDTGGYTGNDEGLAYLHNKEIVLNKVDTANMLKMVEIARSTMGYMKDFKPQNVQPQNVSYSNDVTLHIDQIVLESGGKKGAMEMLDIIKGSIKTNGGLNNE